MTAANPVGIEGRIRLTLSVAREHVRQVRVASTRNVHACRVLHGKPVDQVAVIVPLLFAVCGRAQWVAALTACERAQGCSVSPVERARRALLVLVETAREHGRRLLLDWPALGGRAPALEPIRRLHETLQRIESSAATGAWLREGEAAVGAYAKVLTDCLLGTTDTPARVPVDFAQLVAWSEHAAGPASALIRDVLAQGLEGLGHSCVGTLPALEPCALDEALAADRAGDFVARPAWQGQVYETGPLARMRAEPLVGDLARRFGNGLLTRLVARLAELMDIPRQMQAVIAGARNAQSVGASAAPGGATDTGTGTGTGTATVEAARGRLVHRVEIESGRVRRYQVLAPTEWNFHPEGPLTKGLVGLVVSDAAQLRRQAAMLVTALDPCVAYDIEVE